MKRTIVCVATTERFRRGMARLASHLPDVHTQGYHFKGYPIIQRDWPSHEQRPYAFKAFALKQAADEGADMVLWCDACILPVRSMEPLWDKIERDGYWICRNGWTNYQWTADSAYRDLFKSEDLPDREITEYDEPLRDVWLDDARAVNKTISHVVATSFGLNLRSDIGKAFLDEYYRLASETNAFCGPWRNARLDFPQGGPIDFKRINERWAECGPADILGHRHDQTAASVIAWRLGMTLTDPPEIFAYPPGDETSILLADGSYE